MSQRLGDECTRCGGTGWIDSYDEGVPPEEPGYLTRCWFFDFDQHLGCWDGVVVSEAELLQHEADIPEEGQ